MSDRFLLSVECRLAASHVLPGCPPCDRLHGHTWRVRAFWDFHELDEFGMGANFRDLKQALQDHIRERFDHRHLNEIPPFDRVPPTAENLAKECFKILADEVATDGRGALQRVEVWEGPESCVSYHPDPS